MYTTAQPDMEAYAAEIANKINSTQRYGSVAVSANTTEAPFKTCRIVIRSEGREVASLTFYPPVDAEEAAGYFMLMQTL